MNTQRIRCTYISLLISDGDIPHKLEAEYEEEYCEENDGNKSYIKVKSSLVPGTIKDLGRLSLEDIEQFRASSHPEILL